MFNESAKRKVQSADVANINMIDEEVVGGHSFKGEVFDTIYHVDGTIEKRERSFNIVVDSISTLIGALIKSHNGYNAGTLYWAVGQGAATWDETPYTPVSSAKKLTKEVFRKAIPAENRYFVDASGVRTETVTNRVQFDISFESTEANGFSLREFGIFGGNATDTANSGIMINHKVHSRIDKVEGMRIERSVRFTF